MIHPYLWIAVVGGFVSFLMGAGVGMNDLANAFGTTYGARVLTLTQIVILASICEFGGAVSLGGAVTSTISGGIANPDKFADEPYVFMYGMLCACGAAFCWLAIATWLTLPVSSTHSICGGVMGFALVYGGVNAVSWADRKSDFPFVSGFVPIVASWFISPVLTGMVSAAIFGTIRFFILRPTNAPDRAMYTLPLIVFMTFFLESFFILFKGASKQLNWTVTKALWVAVCIAAGAGLLSIAFIPLLKSRIHRSQKKRAAEEEEERRAIAEMELQMSFNNCVPTGAGQDGVAVRTVIAPKTTAVANDKLKEEPTGSVVPETSGEPILHLDGEHTSSNDDGSVTGDAPFQVQIYSSDVEHVYRYLQVFTAICASFAHGASDVSNAVGPFAAIYQIYQSEVVSKKSDTPIWILCLGGAGLVVGLATFGIRLMRLLGEKITVITPSRGFSAELSAALVVSVCSAFGIPVSSTHCITGAVVAISILDVGFMRVRWLMVLKMYAGWVLTLAITALMSATFFAQGINSPVKRS